MPFILNEKLVNNDELINLNVTNLKQLCKQEGYKKYNKMKKQDIINLLLTQSSENSDKILFEFNKKMEAQLNLENKLKASEKRMMKRKEEIDLKNKLKASEEQMMKRKEEIYRRNNYDIIKMSNPEQTHQPEQTQQPEQTPQFIMDETIKISSKKYNTIGELLKAPINSIVLVSINEKDVNIKSYLFEWLYQNHYSKKEMSGNLTDRIKKISNQPCYHHIIKNIFENDILQTNKQIKQILNEDCVNFIKMLHNIQPSLTGTFLDYLMRRIICEKTNNIFYDSRAYFECKCKPEINDDSKQFSFDNLSIPINDSYLRATNTQHYQSKNILLEIFISSLSHTLAFGGIPNQDKVDNIIHLIQNTQNIIELFYIPIEELCIELLGNNPDILLNPSLGYKISLLNDKNIPSDCDLVINDVLYDIKCTIGNNSIYEILQLMGYTSLLKFVPNYNKKINNVCIINLLQGCIINYDISYITTEQMMNYLKFLTR